MRSDTKTGRNIGKKQQKSLKNRQNIGEYELINETMKKSLDFPFYCRFLVENFGKKSLNFSTKYQANFYWVGDRLNFWAIRLIFWGWWLNEKIKILA